MSNHSWDKSRRPEPDQCRWCRATRVRVRDGPRGGSTLHYTMPDGTVIVKPSDYSFPCPSNPTARGATIRLTKEELVALMHLIITSGWRLDHEKGKHVDKVNNKLKVQRARKGWP